MVEESTVYETKRTQEKFDFNGWKSAGEQMYESLLRRESKLSEELDDVRGQITGAEGILGKKKPTRRKIRPVLRRMLTAAGESGLMVDALISNAAAELGVKEKSVETALNRFVFADPAVSIEETSEGNVVHLHVPLPAESGQP